MDDPWNHPQDPLQHVCVCGHSRGWHHGGNTITEYMGQGKPVAREGPPMRNRAQGWCRYPSCKCRDFARPPVDPDDGSAHRATYHEALADSGIA